MSTFAQRSCVNSTSIQSVSSGQRMADCRRVCRFLVLLLAANWYTALASSSLGKYQRSCSFPSIQIVAFQGLVLLLDR